SPLRLHFPCLHPSPPGNPPPLPLPPSHPPPPPPPPPPPLNSPPPKKNPSIPFWDYTSHPSQRPSPQKHPLPPAYPAVPPIWSVESDDPNLAAVLERLADVKKGNTLDNFPFDPPFVRVVSPVLSGG
uniref:Uncharacterized protein n=1 Tax=Pseudonaja textilis TaxID=8673 RepID=A0A670ZP48_PSETE